MLRQNKHRNFNLRVRDSLSIFKTPFENRCKNAPVLKAYYSKEIDLVNG